MATTPELQDRPRVLVVGGGYVGLYVALKLQKKIANAGGIVTLVDPLPYMTYQPFLPEVAGGNIEARHAVVSHRQHLKQTELIQGRVTAIDHANRTAVVVPAGGEPFEIPYFDVVLAAGAITRTFPIKGLADKGIGIKTIEEAVALRNKVLDRIEVASTMTDPAERAKALTFVVVGGGFAGIECITEMEDLARAAVEKNPRVRQEEIRFVLVEAMGRIMPEVTQQQAEWVVEHLRSRGIEVLLNTSLDNAETSIKLINMADKSPAQEFEADTLVWAAGVQANPMVRSTDFPLEPRGRVRVLPDLRIAGDEGIIDNAWAAGDIAAVPDLTGNGLPDGTCVPNAQHALRQAKRLAKNLWASRWEKPLHDYKHKNLGAVAGFGEWKGVANINLLGRIGLKGGLAWLAHRGYHGMAMPTFERKFRVIFGWIMSFFMGRDTTQLLDLDRPRAAFVAAATPPAKPAPATPDKAPAAPVAGASGSAESTQVKPAESLPANAK